MEPGRTLLRVEHATRRFRMGEVEVVALRDATLEVRSGELLVVEGPSGSGKSTLLNLIGGMDRPSEGSVFFASLDLAQASDAELTHYRRTQVGFVFQFYNLVPTLTAIENVEIATEIADQPLAADAVLEMVGLRPRADHFPAQLSGGEQQRVAIARAIASNPKILLCDEPTGALDVATGRQVITLLAHLRRSLGKAVVVITHNRAISEVADRVAVMRDGTIERIDVNASPLPVAALDW